MKNITDLYNAYLAKSQEERRINERIIDRERQIARLNKKKDKLGGWHANLVTYQQALFSQRFYRRHPQRTRETNRPIVDPFWEIKPITKKEYLAGLWDELPFPRTKKTPPSMVTFSLFMVFYPL